MLTIIAQIIGIFAMLFHILAFQFKSNKNVLLCFGAGSLLFSLNYFLLGGLSGAGFNLINIFRSATAVNKKTHNNVFFGITCLLYLMVAILTYDNPWTIVLLLAQLVATYSLWYKDGAFIRRAQISFVSPVWLINNIFVTFTVGGIICEAFSILSALVSFIRYGKNGFINLER